MPPSATASARCRPPRAAARWMAGRRRRRARWRCCLVLDQFPRNLHRGTAEAFACDPQGARRGAAGRAARPARPGRLTATERVFLYLPFEHSEAMADQDLSVALFEGQRDARPLTARRAGPSTMPGGTGA